MAKVEIASEKLIYSAGDGKSLELVLNKGIKGFAIYDSGSDKCTFVTRYSNVVPMTVVPWKYLSGIPVEYGNAYALYKEVRSFIYDYVEMPCEEDYDVLSAWVLASYRFKEFDSFPYLCAIGPRDSGKTRLLKALCQLSYRGLLGAAITTSAMFHAIEKDSVSIFFDQAELFATNKEETDIIAIVNNGYQKGGQKLLYNQEKECYEGFDCYSPKAFASTMSVRGTIESRSIVFNMQRKTRKNIPIKIDETRAFELRSKLLLYRFRNSERSEESEDSEERCKLITDDGRLVELFVPLVSTTLESSFPSLASLSSLNPAKTILSYLEKIDKSRENEEQASIDAQIIRAIDEASDILQDEKISYAVITEAFNKLRSEKEQWGTKSVARKVKDLGYEPCRLSGGLTGIWRNEDRLKKHKERFMKAAPATLTLEAQIAT